MPPKHKIVKVRDEQRILFQFYLNFRFDGCPSLTKIPFVQNGCSALECFVWYDSHGELLPCKEPDELQRAFEGKQHINLQIKMWCEGVVEGTFFLDEIKGYCIDYPPWVFQGVVRQVGRELIKQHGFVPTFVRNQLN